MILTALNSQFVGPTNSFFGFGCEMIKGGHKNSLRLKVESYKVNINTKIKSEVFCNSIIEYFIYKSRYIRTLILASLPSVSFRNRTHQYPIKIIRFFDQHTEATKTQCQN